MAEQDDDKARWTVPCGTCGEEMEPGLSWHLDHDARSPTERAVDEEVGIDSAQRDRKGQAGVGSREAGGGVMGRAQGYRDLVAWQKAMVLVRAVYDATRSWPRDELYGLTNQARRAAVSIPANIAEGQGRQGKAEMLHHLSVAHGSLHELETHILIARDLGYLDAPACDALIAQTEEVGRLLGGLMRSLR